MKKYKPDNMSLADFNKQTATKWGNLSTTDKNKLQRKYLKDRRLFLLNDNTF